MWRRKLWRLHVLIFLGVSYVSFEISSDHGLRRPENIIVSVVIGLVVVGLLPLWPMAMFKPRTRFLRIDDSGIYTEIGSRKGRRSWSQIASVYQDGDFVVIEVRGGNAFLIPDRAFADSAQRQAVLSLADQMVSKKT